jgi:hypothetical protein
MDVDYGPQLNVLTWLLISISGLFLFTRLYLKNCQHRGLWWDDWILLASWVALATSAGWQHSLDTDNHRQPLGQNVIRRDSLEVACPVDEDQRMVHPHDTHFDAHGQRSPRLD